MIDKNIGSHKRLMLFKEVHGVIPTKLVPVKTGSGNP